MIFKYNFIVKNRNENMKILLNEIIMKSIIIGSGTLPSDEYIQIMLKRTCKAQN